MRQRLLFSVFIVVVLAWPVLAQDSVRDSCDRAAASPFDRQRRPGLPGIPGGKIDVKTAVPACESAAKNAPNDPTIAFQLGRAYQIAKMYEMARTQYERAAASGYAAAQGNLGTLYANGLGGPAKDTAAAARLFKLAADQGYAIGQSTLGYFYAQGQGGLQKDEREAARLYKLAAAQGDNFARVSLGVFYNTGSGGLDKNEREATRLFKLAADDGYADGQLKLGLLYETGGGGLAKSNSNAVRLYKLAAEQGYAPAQDYLAFCYENGIAGLRPDLAEARRLYKLAADGGNASAQFEVGRYYENGTDGFPRNEREALRLYQLSADQGYDEARARLHALRKSQNSKSNSEMAKNQAGQASPGAPLTEKRPPETGNAGQAATGVATAYVTPLAPRPASKVALPPSPIVARQAPVELGKRFAVVMGVNKYPNFQTPEAPNRSQLTKAVNDAEALRDLLAKRGFDVVTALDPTLAEMKTAIGKVKEQLRPDDTVFFFFSGHGLSPAGTNLLLPSDFPDINKVEYGMQRLVRASSYSEYDIINDFKEKLIDAKTGRQRGLIIFVLDACRVNPFIDGSNSVEKALGRDIGILPQRPVSGVFAIYSAGIGQEALDRLSNIDSERNSVFMRVFLRELSTPGVSLSTIIDNTKRTVSELAESVTDRKTGRRYIQRPAYYNETDGPVFLAGSTDVQ